MKYGNTIQLNAGCKIQFKEAGLDYFEPLTNVEKTEFQRLYKNAHRNLHEAYKQQAKSYDLKRREVNYQIGNLVMRRLHILSSAADAIIGKLAPRFQGPCQILQKAGANILEVFERTFT